ncbi:MAG: 3-isopropylmalate dehydrogenase [Peptococcaceae bacterium]|jgi:3-isopropylmalate dehydrogenase|nr:3-isopropylmalate dehydrogenase [Peptococcaceae bacterium]
MPKIAVLPGDGIGQEIMPQALRVLKHVVKNLPDWECTECIVGGAAIDLVGKALPEETLKVCKKSDAILLGAVGGPKWDNLPGPERPEMAALLGLRKAFGLYANIRPVKMMPFLLDASPLKRERVENVDMIIVRELSSGLYFGEKGRKTDPPSGYDVMIYSEEEVRRILHVGFKTAQARSKRLCSVDKANVLETSRFWREIANDVAKEYPDVQLSHMYADNAGMQLVLHPSQFDVMVTDNTFGDLLSDIASVLGGSIGMLSSASLGNNIGLYEPAHGSAPDIAGQNIANPLAMIISVASMFRHSFARHDIADKIEQAIDQVFAAGYRTGDIAKPGDQVLGTKEMGDAVLAALA